MKYHTLFLLLFLLLSACRSGLPEEDPQDRPPPFFDLSGYFEGEVERLNREQPRVQKQVAVNGQTEEQQLDSLDYEKELSVFLNSDINRPAWFDQYRIDSLRENDRLRGLHYEAQNEDLRIRQIDIRFENGEVSEVVVEKKADNIIAGSEQHIEYRPESGYQISSRQNTAISKEQELDISVRFLD